MLDRVVDRLARTSTTSSLFDRSLWRSFNELFAFTVKLELLLQRLLVRCAHVLCDVVLAHDLLERIDFLFLRHFRDARNADSHATLAQQR